MTQYVINTGAFPNDGTGDPLRTAFEYVNLNFDQIFNAGPVLSNIEIINNSIITTNTNGNLILNPNGIGNVIGNAHVIPDTDSIRNLGAIEYRWDTVYARYFVGDGNGISNVTAANISNGTARVDAYFNGNVSVTANGVANVAVFTTDGLVVANSISAGLFVGNVNTTNITGDSVTISATGTNQGINLVPNGTGNVSISFKNIVNLAEPVNPQDAATKYYVDTMAQGLDVKASCLLATQAPLPAYTYNNGASGVGATITGNVAGALSIDGDLATANSRVLIKNESGLNQPYNGIYVVTNPGDIGNVYVLTRSTDFDNGAPSGEIPGAFTFIEAGVSNADTGWVCTTNNPVTVGVTPISWTQFSGAGAYTAGEGLNLVGGVFNALVDNDTTEINLSNQIAVKPNANLVTPNIGAATGTSLSVTGEVAANSISTSGIISTTANIVGGNLLTTGAVSATSDVTGGNLITSGFVTASGQILSAGNINGANFNTTGKISATGNITGGNLVTANNVVATDVLASGLISSAGNVLGSNLITSGAVLAATANVIGNIESGNILNSGIVSSTGNIIGGNIRTAGQITATGNLTVGNVRTSGLVSATGDIVSNSNISGANIDSTGIITASGNIISNQYFIGNGAFLTGIDATSIQNGNSNVRVLANANVTVSVAGTSNVGVFADTGLFVSGVISASGNITGANVDTGNLIATGNVDAGNLNSNTLTGSNVAINSTGDLALNTTGNITVGNTYITNLANPVNLQDAATKYYVDTVATGLDPKESVVYATANVLGVPYTYNNGASGVGATITANLPGALSIDGNSVQSGQRVLIKNEVGVYTSDTVPSAAFNGIYDVTIAGDVGNAFVLTRSSDFDLNTEMASSFTFVEDGSTNADTGWVCTTNNPIVVGFTPITFTQFSGAGTYLAGNGLSLSGSVFNVLVDNNTTEINGNNQVAVKANANLVTPNIGAATGTSLSTTGNITAPTFIGNLVGNISGNIDAGGANTQVQFNNNNVIDGSAGFTFDVTSNAIVVTGNVTGGNLLTAGIVSSTAGIYGDIYTTSIDSGDSSAIIVIPDLILLASLDVNQDLSVTNQLSVGGNIVGNNITASANVTANNVVTENIYGGEITFNATVDGINFVTVGNINVGNTWINNLAEPQQAQDAATKFYVDSVAQGLDIKTAVGLATTTALPVYTYNNGVSGVGATLTATANGALSIDSTSVTTDERVLIKNEINGNAPYNGIYVVTQTGNITAPYILTRSSDMNATGEFTSAFTFVQYGNTQADTGWVCTTNPPVTVGTTPITWTQFSGAGTYLAGNGIAITGEFINVLTDGITTAINGSNQIEVKPGAQLTTPNIGDATGANLSLTGNIQTDGTISAVGNITAPTFYGNLVGNITGNIDAGGSNTSVQFNDDNVLAGSNGFTFDKLSNAVVVTGNITGGNVLVGNIVIPSTGNINVANTWINNLNDPVENQDAATKYYVDNLSLIHI